METALIQLLNVPNKTTKLNEKYIINKIELLNELDLIKVDLIKDDKEYKGLVMIKGEVFPIPKENDSLFVECISLKYNPQFQLKLYIKGKIDLSNEKTDNEIVKTSYSFEYSDIFQTLSKLSEINLDKINSDIFIYEKDEKNLVNLKCLSDSKIYQLKLNDDQIEQIKINHFLLMYCYHSDKEKIITNKLTTLEILNEEKLLKIFDTLFFDNVIVVQVIDIDAENFIVIDVRKNIYELNKNQEFIKNYKIDFCSLILISNYKIQGNKMELNNKSSIYLFKKEMYYLENILLNSYTVLKLYFLDFKQNQNMFDCVKYGYKENKIITKPTEYIIIKSTVLKKFEYYPFNIALCNSETSKNSIEEKNFTIFLYPSLMNKINVFLNTNSPKTYFYEFLYYNITDNLRETQAKIIINDSEYNIDIYDSFGSENRKRILIMNIPYQKMEIQENELINNSIQVCELIQNDIHKIVGIYDISSIEFDNYKSNDYFDDYYQNFGDIFDIILNYSTMNSTNSNNIIKAKLAIFNSTKFDIDFDNAFLFEDLMTLSQFKARAGLIICKYMNEYEDDYLTFLKIIHSVALLFTQIKDENLKYSEKIRLLIFTLNEEIKNNSSSNVKLRLISQLKKNSPYILAYNFNIEQIEGLTEFSPLFQAYLQLDAYKAFNYIHNMESQTFSLEQNFMIKYQLLSTYEKFFYVKRKSSSELASLDKYTKITVINEESIFGKNYTEIYKNTDLKKAYNYAMPLSINFLLEKSGHYKYSIKDKNNISPVTYYMGLYYEYEPSYHELLFACESRRIIENFICNDKNIIYALSTKLIFGEFLKPKYFMGRDFNELIEEVRKKLDIYNLKEIEDIRIQNKNKIEKSLSDKLKKMPPFFQLGDLIFDANILRKNIMISKKEKEAELRSYCLKKSVKFKAKKNNIKNII